ncbi:MAG: NAD(+) diphosphatase [Anaerovoracaceae bacterium]
MLHNIKPHKFKNEFSNVEPVEKNQFYSFKEGQVLLFIDTEGTYHLPRVNQLPREKRKEVIYLFSVDEESIFLGQNVEATDTLKYYEFNTLYSLEEKWAAFAGATASHLNRWYSENVLCGICGKPLDHSKTERALVCKDCNIIKYPKISPVVMAAIVDGEKLLLTRYADRPYKKFALIAGFVEIGESLEEAIQREVMEEVGVKVKDLKYFASQPWGFSDSLISGFFMKLDGDSTIHLDYDELAEGVWCERKDLPTGYGDISITAKMIEAFRSGEVKI